MVAAPSAHAAFPGANGKITFTDGNNLFVINPDGTGRQQVPLPNNCGRSNISWSADGSTLASNGCSSLIVVKPDGSGYRAFGTAVNAVGSWSPDSSKLVYGGRCSLEACDDIYSINADGTGQTRLTNTGDSNSPEWSPSGDKIAYLQYQSGNSPAGIYTMTPDGLLPTKIPETGYGDRPTSWSPDGRRIAFSRPETGGQYDIYVAKVDGSGLTQLTSDGQSSDAAWSPDGSKLVFISTRDGNVELYVMNADGTNQTRVTNTPTAELRPDWQPIPYTGYPRPRGATPLRVSLVPAFQQCTNPNSNTTHGAPLAFPSCGPPVQASHFLTINTPDANGGRANATGFLLFKVKTSSPEDVLISGNITDVDCQPATDAGVCNQPNGTDGPDYSGQLQANATIRITDHYNGPGANEAATVVDLPFPVNLTCADTADTSIGGTCNVTTSGAVVCPECGVRQGERTVGEISQLQVFDGGRDGQITTNDNTLFMDQGIFVP
jgi:hypothetical protein